MGKNAGGALAGRVADTTPPRSEMKSRGSLERVSAVDRLELRCRQSDAWEHFIDRCVERFHATTSPEEQSRLLSRIARVLRLELEDEEQAFEAVLEGFRLDPSNHEAVSDLTQLARSLQRWPEVIDAVRGFVEAETETWRRLQMCEQATRWCKEELAGRVRAADAFLVEIHRIDPSHWAVRRRLASFYSEQGIWDLRRTELERALLRASSNEEMRDTHYALAELYELRFSDLTRATEHYEAALGCHPGSLDVLRGLERVYARRELYDRLRDTLEKQVPLVVDRADRHALLLRLADLWETRFLKPAQAAPLLEQALEIVSNDKDALDRLERCYRAMRAWPEYVRTLERRLDVLVLREARVQALMRIGQVCESALDDAAGALKAYQRACALDPSHIEALTELSRLCERSEDWRGAAECREQLAALSKAPHVQAHLHMSLGSLLEPANRDPDRARAHYQRAAQIDHGLSGAWEGLQRLAEQEGAYEDAALFLTQRIARAEGKRAKVRLWGELGLLWERAGAGERAIAAYEEALKISPDGIEIAHQLFRLYGEARLTSKASSLCVQLLRAALAEKDAPRTVELLRGSLAVARAHSDPSSVLSQGVRAVQTFPLVREVTEAVVDLCHALKEEQPDAVRAAREVLDKVVREAPTFSAGALVKVGETLWALDEIERGIDALVAALANDDACVPALQILAEHFVTCGDWERASAYRLWLARATPDPRVRFALLIDTGEALADEADDLEQAAWVYEEARLLEPRDRLLLDRLVSIYSEVGNWERLLDVQHAMVDLEDFPALKASRMRSMALVAQTKLRDPRRSAELFEEVLHLDPSRLDALEEVVALYTEMKDWRALAGVHRRVLNRAEHHARRADPILARTLPLAGSTSNGAVRAAARSDGHSSHPPAIERASAGYESDPRVRALRERIAATPVSGGAFRELYAAFRAMHATDAAVTTCSVLQHLGLVDSAQKRFVAALRTPELSEAKGVLSEADWYANLLHPALDRPLFAAVALAASASQRARAYAGTDRITRALGEPLSPKGTGPGARISRLVHDAARVLHLPVPTLYERAKAAAPFAVSSAGTPVLFVSFSAIDALAPGTLPFVLGRSIAELHPLLVARSAFPTASEMRLLFETAVRAIEEDGTVETSSAVAALRSGLTEDERGELAAAIAMTRDRPQPPDFERFHHLLDVTTMRVGLLLQGVVDRAWEAMRHETRLACDFPAAELRAELLTFAVSGEYLRLRDATGLTVRSR